MSQMCGTYKVWDLKGDVTGMVYQAGNHNTQARCAEGITFSAARGWGFALVF